MMNGKIMVHAALALAALHAGSAHATVTGGAVVAGAPGAAFFKLGVPFTESDPDNTVGNNTFQNTNLYAFDEDQNIVLVAPLSVDQRADGTPGALAAGDTVASHYIFFDPGPAADMLGTIDFDSDIVGILSSTGLLLASDFLANTGVTYLNPGARGLEPGDTVTISGARQVTADFRASSPGDYIRVLTRFSPTAAPEPGVAALLVLGLGVVALRRTGRGQA